MRAMSEHPLLRDPTLRVEDAPLDQADALRADLWTLAGVIRIRCDLIRRFVHLRDDPGTLYAGKSLLAESKALARTLELLVAAKEANDAG
jgi:hypothetical protein